MPKTSKAAQAPATPSAEKTTGKDNLLQFRSQLEAQQTELNDRILSTVEQGRETGAEPAPDAVDQAVSAYQRELLFTRSNHEHDQLQLVRQALERVDDGSFGTCIECEEKIGAKRLEALPWTPYCIECQERIERDAAEEQLRQRAS